MTQVRVTKDSCSSRRYVDFTDGLLENFDSYDQTCYDKWDHEDPVFLANDVDRSPYGKNGLWTYRTGLSNWEVRYWTRVYGTEGHVAELPVRRINATMKMEQLLEEGLFDRGTRAFAVSGNVYNTHVSPKEDVQHSQPPI